MAELPLGKETGYPDQYAPDVLCRIERADNRQRIGLGPELPFSGTDVWNAWDLTWLGEDGQPQAATAEIHVPADSPGIVESKSMKLYLGSFAMSRYASAHIVREHLAADLGACVGASVAVRIDVPDSGHRLRHLPGESLDRTHVQCARWQVEPGLLAADPDAVGSEALYTHALRSLCPVTGQPDLGSVLIRYEGPRIDRACRSAWEEKP
jgi:7-cyano-7-deazaguanine reductase